jgi:hypothetical protein
MDPNRGPAEALRGFQYEVYGSRVYGRKGGAFGHQHSNQYCECKAYLPQRTTSANIHFGWQCNPNEVRY